LENRLLQPEGAWRWFVRIEYLATVRACANERRSRVRQAFAALDRIADERSTATRTKLIHDWADDFGFLDPWLVDIWEETVDRWRDFPDARRAWDIAWPSFTYFEDQDEIVPTKRTFTHFRWLVLHQVGRLTYEDIAERVQSSAGLRIPSVSRAITTMATLIGVTLRPARRRRPNLRTDTHILS
jgi:hypothetical protein